MFIRAKVLLSAYGVTCMTSQALGVIQNQRNFKTFAFTVLLSVMLSVLRLRFGD